MKRLRSLLPVLFLQLCSAFGQPGMNWVSLPQNFDFTVESMTVYDGKLIAAGDFTLAGGQNINKIAAWNGSTWSGLGNGMKGFFPRITEILVFNNELYAVGRFDSAGTVASKNIAKWNGTNWISLANSCNNLIFAIAVYNNEIYVAGAFTNINGVSANHIAKWTGTNWQALAAGLYGPNVNDLCVYQNELYAVGPIDSANHIACKNIARWNGTSWNTVSTGFPNGAAALYEWQGNLLIYGGQISQWNGSNLTLFSTQVMPNTRAFCTHNSKLYAAGINTSSISTVREWNPSASVWDTVGTGVDLIYTLCDYNGELYCAGGFKISTGANADYIAKWGIPTGIKNYSDKNFKIDIYPNPTSDKLIFEHDQINKISVTNSFGQLLYTLNNPLQKQEIDLSFLSRGVYYLKAQSNSGQRVFKVIKE